MAVEPSVLTSLFFFFCFIYDGWLPENGTSEVAWVPAMGKVQWPTAAPSKGSATLFFDDREEEPPISQNWWFLLRPSSPLKINGGLSDGRSTKGRGSMWQHGGAGHRLREVDWHASLGHQ